MFQPNKYTVSVQLKYLSKFTELHQTNMQKKQFNFHEKANETMIQAITQGQGRGTIKAAESPDAEV